MNGLSCPWVIEAPLFHQCCVTAALQKYLGKFCHIYQDDIVIWSQDIVEHEKNVQLIFQVLIDAKLYCNKKKTKLFCFRVNFLGHTISQDGIEVDEKKAESVSFLPSFLLYLHLIYTLWNCSLLK